MAKDEGIEVQGTIIEKHPGGIFDVKLDDEHVVLARIAGKPRRARLPPFLRRKVARFRLAD